MPPAQVSLLGCKHNPELMLQPIHLTPSNTGTAPSPSPPGLPAGLRAQPGADAAGGARAHLPGRRVPARLRRDHPPRRGARVLRAVRPRAASPFLVLVWRSSSPKERLARLFRELGQCAAAGVCRTEGLWAQLEVRGVQGARWPPGLQCSVVPPVAPFAAREHARCRSVQETAAAAAIGAQARYPAAAADSAAAVHYSAPPLVPCPLKPCITLLLCSRASTP